MSVIRYMQGQGPRQKIISRTFPTRPSQLWFMIIVTVIGLLVPFVLASWFLIDLISSVTYRIVTFFLILVIFSNIASKILIRLFDYYDPQINHNKKRNTGALV